MSITKRYLEESQFYDDMMEWIKENGSPSMKEGSEEFNDLKNKYLHGNAEFASSDPFDYWDQEEYDSQISWTKQQKAFDTFISQMVQVQKNLTPDASQIILKMNYSFAVTLMESCLGDMLRGIVFSDKYYLKNAIKNVNELKNTKFSLAEFYEQEDLINKVTLQVLTKEYSYHHIQRTTSLYHSVIQEKLSEAVTSKISDMNEVIDVRHDIVHRNGFTIDDKEHELDFETVSMVIKTIVNFVTAMRDYTLAAEAKRVFS